MRKQKENTSKDILKQAECSPKRESFCLLPWKLMYVYIYISIYLWKLMVGSWTFLLKWSLFRAHVSLFCMGKPSINFTLQIYTSLDPRIFPEDVSSFHPIGWNIFLFSLNSVFLSMQNLTAFLETADVDTISRLLLVSWDFSGFVSFFVLFFDRQRSSLLLVTAPVTTACSTRWPSPRWCRGLQHDVVS